MRTLYHILFLSIGLILTSCRDCLDMPQYSSPDDVLNLNCSATHLFNIHEVTSRGQDQKTVSEQEIRTLHVFLFDTSGQYLEAAEGKEFQGYRHSSMGGAPFAIDKNGWRDIEKARHATIIVLANLEQGTFTPNGSTYRSHPQNINQLDDLLAFTYHPLRKRILSVLPEEGMPMYGRIDNVDLTTGNTSKSLTFPMRALMSRIDFNIRIDGRNHDTAHGLPQLTVTQAEVLNAPLSTSIHSDAGIKTDLARMGKKDYTLPLGKNITIQHQQGILSYHFYVFENIQEPASQFNYPEGINENEKQRYKPLIADKEHALAFRLNGTYLTHNGGTYNVIYTLYLGANHTNDFKIKRNHQYKNNITIRGIDQTQSNTGTVTLDARVNISESNPFYIAMLKERNLDSHFNIVPMDIHFFNTHLPSDTRQTMDIEIVNPDRCKWLRMEKIPARHMQEGTLPSVSDNGPSLLSTGSFRAGHGKRRYFTTDLVTRTLSANTHATADAHRDRIYLYVDENLEVWHLGTNEPRTRTAQIRFVYKENGKIKSSHELTIEQARLLEVRFHDDENNNFNGKSFYMEAYEEYMDYGDPLDDFSHGQVYPGLPWGAQNRYIGRTKCRNAHNLGYRWVPGYINAHENWYWGWEFTPCIANKDIDTDHLHSTDNNYIPQSAAVYCLLKNKRNADGNIDSNRIKWYLPGIRELERMLEDYYQEYDEFQNNYYWSSTPGKSRREDVQHARATKAYKENDTFKYYESSAEHIYNGENGTGGFTPRQGVKLRVRAARIDNLP